MTNYLNPNHWQTAQLVDELNAAATEMRTLQFIEQLKPVLSIDGNQYCYLLGEMPKDYVVGFGDTTWKAAQDFHNNYINSKP